MLFEHSMSIAQQLISIYNTTVYKNKNIVTHNVKYSGIQPRPLALSENILPTDHQEVQKIN